LGGVACVASVKLRRTLSTVSACSARALGTKARKRALQRLSPQTSTASRLGTEPVTLRPTIADGRYGVVFCQH
jgi:hypothetical protein